MLLSFGERSYILITCILITYAQTLLPKILGLSLLRLLPESYSKLLTKFGRLNNTSQAHDRLNDIKQILHFRFDFTTWNMIQAKALRDSNLVS